MQILRERTIKIYPCKGGTYKTKSNKKFNFFYWQCLNVRGYINGGYAATRVEGVVRYVHKGRWKPDTLQMCVERKGVL